MIKYESSSLDESMNNFMLEMETIHPNIVPISVFSTESLSLKSFNTYREATKSMMPVKIDKMMKESVDQKLKWMKQVTDLVLYIIGNTEFVLKEKILLQQHAVLDSDNNIILVNLTFLKCNHSGKDNKNSNSIRFWDIAGNFVFKDALLFIKLPINIKMIFNSRNKGIIIIFILKEYLDKYSPNTDLISLDISKYLLYCYVEKKIEGHQCHVTIFRRNLISPKKLTKLFIKDIIMLFQTN